MDRYLTKDEIHRARANGISYDNLYNRVYKLGWDFERAVTTPLNMRDRNSLWVQWKPVALANGIKAATFINRVKGQGMTPEEAATKPITPASERARESNKIRQYNAKITPDIRERAEANGIIYDRLSQRVYKLKWDIERACTEPIGTSKFVFGKKYS